MSKKKKFYITTTIALSLFFFRGQTRLWKKKYDVCAISAEREKLESFAAEEGINYKYLPLQREISLWADSRCLMKYIWIFLRDRPFIVHGNTPKASLLSMLAAWITRRPVRIYMCHGLRYQGTQGRLRTLLMVMEKITCMCATHIISVSKGIADTMDSDGLCKKEKIRVVGFGSAGGVDTERFNPNAVVSTVRKDLGIPDDAVVFSFVGRIVKDKGITELVNAFEKISKERDDVHLLLVGPIEDKHNPVDKATHEKMLKNTHIHSVGMQQDVRPYLKVSNAFVLPSYREGFGMVLIEAGSMGLPCITTDITGCNEIIIPGENGAIVEPRNEEALYGEMKKWLDNPELVLEMAGKARKLVEDRYECHTVWEQYFRFYNELVTNT